MGQHDLARDEAFRADEGFADLDQGLRHAFDAHPGVDDDRRDREQENDDDLHQHMEAEPQDEHRQEGDQRGGVEADEIEAEALFDQPGAAEHQSDRHAEQHRQPIADEQRLQALQQGIHEHAGGQLLDERDVDRARMRGEQRIAAAPGELPDGHQQHEGADRQHARVPFEEGREPGGPGVLAAAARNSLTPPLRARRRFQAPHGLPDVIALFGEQRRGADELRIAARTRDRDLDDLGELTRGRHHEDAVRQQHGLVEVMGDEHDRLLHLLVQADQLGLQALARMGVERAERLVHEQQVGIDRERAGQPDALAHAAGELVGPARLGARKADQLEIAPRDPLALRRAHALGLEPELDIGERAAPGQELGVLEHHGALVIAAEHRPARGFEQAGRPAASAQAASAATWSCRSRSGR